MKEVLICILVQYADWEVSYVSTLILSFGQGRFDIKTVSLTKEPVKSLGGLTVIPDYDINSVPEDFEAVLLIGGICDAVRFLATMGVLNNVFYTGNGVLNLQNWENSKYIGEEKFVLEDAVGDNKIVTANGTGTLDFAKEVLSALDVCDEEKINEWIDFYKNGFYKAPMLKI